MDIMDDTRKKIIVNEIVYWKKNKMLPEQYCDYLLALYTEGNQPEEKKTKNTKNKRMNKSLLLLMLVPVIVFLLYFTELSFDLQMALYILLLLIGIGATIYFFKKGILFQVSLIISALILLLLTVEFTIHLFPEQPIALYISLFINCLVWALIGRKLKLLYFLISGILGISVLVISIFL